MKTVKKISLLWGFSLLCIAFSCRKDFLDTKPSASLVVPTSLDDFQAILDNVSIMNGSGNGTLGITVSFGGPNPMLLEVATDNYYIPDNIFTPFVQYNKSVYTWSKEDPYGGARLLSDWSFPYRAVFYSNVVLDGLKTVPQSTTNQADWNRVKGSALFYRAWAFYQLAQTYAPLYDKDKAKDLLGIPIKHTSDINEKISRANLEDTYSQIINDLKESIDLLPNVPLYKTRPSVPAVYGLLARIYLSISDYASAQLYAKKVLESYNGVLLDFNIVKSTPTYPFTRFSSEVIFSSLNSNKPYDQLFGPSTSRVDSLLYRAYVSDDLRKVLFFTLREPNVYSFRGGYDGSSLMFYGVTLDEIYLIMAESLVREHDVATGIKYLNELLTTRFKVNNGKSTFIPYDISNEEDALILVLKERRKELVMRGLRFSDLRRLNKDPRFAKTLIRKVNGETYELPPNDLRYTWPIPNEVIALNGIQQNPR